MDQSSIFMMDRLGWPTTLGPLPVSQHHSSVPRYNGTPVGPHDRSDDFYVSSNSPLDDLSLPHADVGSANAALMVSDEVSPPSHHLYDSGRHLEVPGLASGPSQFIGGGDPLPTEGPNAAYTPDLLQYFSLPQPSELGHPYHPTTSPPTSSPEIYINTSTALEPVPFQFYPPLLPPRDSSWNFHSNEMGALSASTVTYESTRENHVATTSIGPGTRSINMTSSRKAPVTTHSGIHPTSRPSNQYGSIPDSDQGDRLDSSDPDFRSARQGRRHTTAAVSPMASSQYLSPRRASKEHWCKECDTCFAQKQALRRHLKDVHRPRQLCPLCDFEWSPGRKYILRDHFGEKHSGVAFPKFLQRQRSDSRGSRRRA